ncbi:MAG TPA: hypothetical protein VFA88_09185 [Gaiellaceae bacterium]|nr:hypothetical protein [Gaiellaceae bacterium]
MTAAISAVRRLPAPRLAVPYGGRFAAAYALLGLVLAAVAFAGVRVAAERPARAGHHAAVRPQIDLAAAEALAASVRLHYPPLAGAPPFTIAAVRPTLGPYELTSISLARPDGTAPLPLLKSTAGLLEYTFCGRGLFCAYAPNASLALQQAVAEAEGVQLALDSFASLHGVTEVLEFLPAAGPGVPSVALYFRRHDLAPIGHGEEVSSIATGLLDSGAAARSLPAPLRAVLAVATRHSYLYRGQLGGDRRVQLVLSPLAPSSQRLVRPLP